MKTIRTIIATLSAVLLTYALVAWFSVRRSAAFIQRTIYQGFDQTFVVALVMGSAFLLIAVILTVAIFSTDEDDDEEDEERYRPRPRTRPIPREGQAYRRVSRDRTQDQGRPARREDSNFVRPRTRAEETLKPRKRMADRTEELAFREEEAPVKREKKAPKAAPKRVAEPEEVEEDLEPVAEPEEVEEVREPVPEAEPQAAPDEALEPAKEEDTVRCVYCGSAISRDSLFCPRCGKKR